MINCILAVEVAVAGETAGFVEAEVCAFVGLVEVVGAVLPQAASNSKNEIPTKTLKYNFRFNKDKGISTISSF